MQVCLENKLLQLKSLALQDWTAGAAKSMNTNFKDRFANKANSHRKKPEAVVIVYDFPPRFDLLTWPVTAKRNSGGEENRSIIKFWFSVHYVKIKINNNKFMWIRVFGVTFTSFAFLFQIKSMWKEKSNYFKISFHLPAAMYDIDTRMYFVHKEYTKTYTYMPRFSPSGFFRPFKFLVPTPGPTSENRAHVQGMCVYVNTLRLTHPHILLAPSKNTENTDKTSIFLHIKNNVPLPCVTDTLHLRSPTLMNKQNAYTSARARPTESVFANVWTDVKTLCI